MINFKQKFAELQIKNKLQLMNLLICFAFLLIILIVATAFFTLRNLSVDVSIQDTRKVIVSSQLSRQIAEIFSDIDLLSNTFYGKDTYLQFAGDGLISTVNKLAANTDSLPLKTSLANLATDFDSFLSQCGVVNTILHTKEITYSEILEALSRFEILLGELLVELTLRDEDTSFVEQLLMLVVTYRESFLEIGKMHQGQAYNLLVHPQEKPVVILKAIDDLLLRLQTITASRPDIARHGVTITRHVQKYRKLILKYHDATLKLARQKTLLLNSKLSSMAILEKIDTEVSESSQLIANHIERIIIISGIAVLLLTLSLVVILVYTTAFLAKTTINTPMQKVLSGIQSLANDNLEIRLRLDRKDEWDDIEKGLNNMASNLLKTRMTLEERSSALMESEQFLNSVIENIPNMIFIKDADELRFVRLNKAGEELLGYPKESFIGKNDFDFFPENEAMFFTEKDREVLADKKLIDITQEPIQTNNRGKRLLHTKKIPIIDENGHPKFLLGISEDITERIQAEKKLNQYAKTQTVLLQEVNHRVKNNLTAIISMLHQEEDSAGESNREIRLQEVISRIEGLLTVHSLLSASQWKPLSLSLLCKKIILGSRNFISIGKSVNLEVPSSQILVDSDQAHYLTLVLNELATNSMKYATRNNMVHIKVSFDQKDGYNTLKYHDDGPGYPDSVLLGELSKHNIGLNLILGIIKISLRGNIELSNENGGMVRIIFPAITLKPEDEGRQS